MKQKSYLLITIFSLLLGACSTLTPQEQSYEQGDLWQAINQLKVDQTYFASKEELTTLSEQVSALKAENQALLQQIEDLKKNQSKQRRPVAVPSVVETSVEKPETAQQTLYQEAKNLYNKKQYSKVVQLLKTYAFGADHSSEAQNAMYLLGSAHLKLNHCEAAIDINRRFASLFAQHHNAPDALYNVLSCQVSLQQKDIARETYILLQKRYPNSNAVIRAQTRLKQRGL